jgi:glutathione S-transferase
MPVLYVGNRNYSSWSLRPWLVLRWSGLPFEERVIPMGGPGYGAGRMPEILAVSPTGKVPVLDVDGEIVWDSLAIAEWAADRVPALWPADRMRRALARSAVAEMHSGFAAIRRDLSMNLRRRAVVPSWPDDTRADLERLYALLGGLRARFGADGPWLFGARSIADAFYLPVATRLRTYGVTPPPAVAGWCATALGDADFRVWEAEAEREEWTIPGTEALWRGQAPG